MVQMIDDEPWQRKQQVQRAHLIFMQQLRQQLEDQTRLQAPILAQQRQSGVPLDHLQREELEQKLNYQVR